MKSGDSLRDMAKKINISPSYLSSIENEKREVPADLGDKLVVAYNLNSEESKQVHEAIAESMNVVKVKTDELTPEEKSEYFNRVMNTITSFDDDIILAQRNIKTEHKAFILYKKHKTYPSIIKTEKGLCYSFNQDEIIRYISRFNLHLNYFGVQNNKLKIEGWYAYAKYLSEEPTTPLIILEDNTIVSPTLKKPINGRVSFDEIISYKIPFEFNLDILELSKLQFAYDTPKGIELCKRVVIDTPFFIPENEREQFTKKHYKFKLNSDKTISIEKQ